MTPPDHPKPPPEVFDFSFLDAADDGFQIDAGVTSGADPSEWDPIDIEGRVDSCVSDDGSKSGDKSAPAICGPTQKQQQ